jgi:uncharacterized protein YcnI
MRAKRSSRALIAISLATASAIAVSAVPASAHMGLVTYGTTFTANATNLIYFRVPHGCPDPDAATHGGFNAITNRVEVNISDVTKVASVKPEQKPGWNVTVTRDVTNAVTQITWSARTVDDALRDWTFGDFGVRATLNGAAGDVIAFPAKQYCDYDNMGNALAVPATETWAGVDAPKLTLVSANKVTSAADLADLKGRVTALETSVAGALASIAGLVSTDGSLTSRLATAESTLGNVSTARLGYVTAGKTAGRLAVTVDLPTIYRSQPATLKVNGTTVKAVTLNSWGDGSALLTKAASAAFSTGQTVQVLVGATVVATGTVG